VNAELHGSRLLFCTTEATALMLPDSVLAAPSWFCRESTAVNSLPETGMQSFPGSCGRSIFCLIP
jgi:hypothetical protein